MSDRGSVDFEALTHVEESCVWPFLLLAACGPVRTAARGQRLGAETD